MRGGGGVVRRRHESCGEVQASALDPGPHGRCGGAGGCGGGMHLKRGERGPGEGGQEGREVRGGCSLNYCGLEYGRQAFQHLHSMAASFKRHAVCLQTCVTVYTTPYTEEDFDNNRQPRPYGTCFAFDINIRAIASAPVAKW